MAAGPAMLKNPYGSCGPPLSPAVAANRCPAVRWLVP